MIPVVANEVLPPVFDERVVRLHLGIEPVDALGRPGPIAGLGVHVENGPRPFELSPAARASARAGQLRASLDLPGVPRNPSGRFAIAFGARLDRPEEIEQPDRSVEQRLTVRVLDDRRRYVPRRLSIPVPTRDAVLAAEHAHDLDVTSPLAPRAARPWLHPGADYGVAAGTTAIRGRVTWGAGGPAARWARIEITPSNVVGAPTWWTHGDEHGEFLAILGPLPQQLAVQKTRTVDVDVVVHARPLPADDAIVDSLTGTTEDPLWHLPVEVVASLAIDDPVSRGTVPPPGYQAAAPTRITCTRGQVTRPNPFVLA